MLLLLEDNFVFQQGSYGKQVAVLPFKFQALCNLIFE